MAAVSGAKSKKSEERRREVRIGPWCCCMQKKRSVKTDRSRKTDDAADGSSVSVKIKKYLYNLMKNDVSLIRARVSVRCSLSAVTSNIEYNMRENCTICHQMQSGMHGEKLDQSKEHVKIKDLRERGYMEHGSFVDTLGLLADVNITGEDAVLEPPAATRFSTVAIVIMRQRMISRLIRVLDMTFPVIKLNR
ncbi:hypothetical protein Ahy_B08g089585 isoform D [Arachis hypogaea]|uniref:Uncharacterized protein n=1 Tax=Arachis hypogaea TaxID=3818 RepID=A0A444XY91_ARAHY|nr:hypothetical protein Ahy_B08g089585 isoform D [Arachis hypogaea]